jgi:hypothetical protein
MRNNFLILAPFPDHRYKQDGMISRIKHIDTIFNKIDRTYLYVSFFKNRRKYINQIDNVDIYELNLFLHFFLICKLILSSKKIYIHSIYQIRHIWFLIPFYKNPKYLDFHGVVPEEIKYFGGNIFSFYYMSFVEKILFSTKKLTVICVTNKMILHLKNKFLNFNGSFILYNIFPNHITDKVIENYFHTDQFENKTTFIYSGSCALWQKIDLMLDLIKENLCENYIFIILTSNIREFEKKIKLKNIPLESIILKSVKPEDLIKYYSIADYGFLLRDDNVVNNVANPTKLIEYLASGITPILLNPNIGDYMENGYEYITLDKFNRSSVFRKHKSEKNKLVAKKMLDDNLNIDLTKIIFKD